MAMVVHKALQGRTGADVRILATDIDTNMVQTASQGIYPLRVRQAFRRIMRACGAAAG